MLELVKAQDSNYIQIFTGLFLLPWSAENHPPIYLFLSFLFIVILLPKLPVNLPLFSLVLDKNVA